jgi:rod shape-determining protein MreC
VPPYDLTDASEAAARRQLRGGLAVVAAALVVLLLPDATQQSTASALRATALRPFLALQEGLVRASLRSASVTELQATLDSLHLSLIARSTLDEENRRLRGLLGLGERIGPSYRAAAVIRTGTPGSESVFLLDIGEADGVRRRAPVLTRAGLAGVIREVRGGTAIGMDWTHPDFRASGMTVDGLTFGWIEAHRGEFREEDRLLFSGTPFSTEIEPGALVVTSGLGGVFPRGVPVGRITTLAEAEGGWQKSYWVEPFVEVGSLTHALVAVGQSGPEPEDLTPAFPPGDALTPAEFLDREAARADSLARLTDEVRRLRARLDSVRGGGSPPPSDGGDAS